MDILDFPDIQALREKALAAKEERERQVFLEQILTAIAEKLSAVEIAKINDDVTVSNLDEFSAALQNGLARATKPLVAMLKSLNMSTQDQTKTIELLEQKSLARFKEEFQPVFIRKTIDRVHVLNFPPFPAFPDKIAINNLAELSKNFEELSNTIRTALNINIPAPQVTVQPPSVNIPETIIPEANFGPLIRAIETNLNKLRTNDVGRPLAVRLSDGQKWINQIAAELKAFQTQFAGFNENMRLRNAQGMLINPARDETFSPATTIVTGKTAVPTAGTAVRITSTSTPIKGVWLSADLGNTNPIVVGDSSVVAANGSQRGIVILPGRPLYLKVSDLSLLYVDAQTNGDDLAWAYET